MKAQEYNTDAELGGSWSAHVQRLADNGGAALTLDSCVLDLWTEQLDPVSAPPTLTTTGVIAANAKSARLLITEEQVAALGVGLFQLRLTLGDPVIGPQVVARGWFTVRGRVNDL